MDLFLGVGVDRGGGLVEDEDARIVQDRPRDADTLAFSAAKGLAAFADLRVVAIGFLDNEIVRVGCFGRRHDVLPCRAGPRKGNVVVDRATEKKRVLEHNTDLRTKILLRDLLDVHAINCDLTLLHLVEAADQIDGRAFACATLADQTDHLPRGHAEADLLKHRFVRLITERHILELHLSSNPRQRHRLFGIPDVRGRIQHLEDALCCGQRTREKVRNSAHEL